MKCPLKKQKIKMKLSKNLKQNKKKHKIQNQKQFYSLINKVILKKLKRMNYFMFKLYLVQLLILGKKFLSIIKRGFKRLNNKRRKLMKLKSFQKKKKVDRLKIPQKFKISLKKKNMKKLKLKKRFKMKS